MGVYNDYRTSYIVIRCNVKIFGNSNTKYYDYVNEIPSILLYLFNFLLGKIFFVLILLLLLSTMK